MGPGGGGIGGSEQPLDVGLLLGRNHAERVGGEQCVAILTARILVGAHDVVSSANGGSG